MKNQSKRDGTDTTVPRVTGTPNASLFFYRVWKVENRGSVKRERERNTTFLAALSSRHERRCQRACPRLLWYASLLSAQMNPSGSDLATISQPEHQASTASNERSADQKGKHSHAVAAH